MICREIPWRSPYVAFSPFVGVPDAHLLHSGNRATGKQWSIMAAFPREVLPLKDQGVECWLGDVQSVIDGRLLSNRDTANIMPIQSGLVGFLGYEALSGLEPSLRLPQSPYRFPDAVFGVYDALVIFSGHYRKAWIVGRCEIACHRLQREIGVDELTPLQKPEFSTATSNFSRSGYLQCVEHIIESIRSGDFYQANIAQTIEATISQGFSGFDYFQFIGEESDANFGAYLQYEDGAILSNSPERLFKTFTNDRGQRCIQVEPIKGTRPRSDDAAKDFELAQSLKDDAKDRAENIMIADLMRNDLSKICEDHSIREDAICELLTLTRVHHLVSRISGVLCEDNKIEDVFRALFPSGSITGAPKIEAMKAIANAEKMGRGPYCGAIGYIGDGGDADFSVSIRTMMIDHQNARLSIPVGGGITIRSTPEDEYVETLVKASSATSGAISVEVDLP